MEKSAHQGKDVPFHNSQKEHWQLFFMDGLE
jgi:hypothetical protein